MDTHQLTPERYRELLHADGELLLASADGHAEAAVSTCPGWTVTDVLAHLGSVYGHKVAVLRLGRRPDEGEWPRLPDDASGEEAIAFCHTALHEIAHELAVRDPAQPCWTFGEDSTVAFWNRRMAQETAVHRVDVQLASGSADPVDAELARDGIDEVVSVFLPRGGEPVPVDVRDLVSGQVSVTAFGATVSGGPSDVLLWMWGRLPDAAVSVSGDPVAFRQALVGGTQ